MKPNLNLVIRIEKLTGQPLICWREDISKVGIYFTREGHGDVSLGWYYTHTRPSNDVKLNRQLFNEYTKDWEGESTPVLREKLNAFTSLKR